MASEQLLQSLQRELAIEKAAREELERQTVLKTRQLWHLREQNDKELQQYQEQLSVLRASLILAHKQQHASQQAQHADLYAASPQQHASPEPQQVAALVIPEQPSTQDDEDASPTKADQRKAAAARQHTPDSPQKQRRSDQQQHASPADPTTVSSLAAAAAAADVPAQEAAGPLSSSSPQQQHSAQPEQQQVVSETAEKLLAAVSKVQQLVEALSTNEPSAAADLSVLQWQLTAIYGGLTCTNSSSDAAGECVGDQPDCTAAGADAHAGRHHSSGTGAAAGQGPRHGILQGVSCTGADPLSASCSPAAAAGAAAAGRQGTAAVYVDATTGTSPQRDAASAGAAAGHTEHQQQQQQVQELSRTAAAAQLFSGAANNSSSGSKLAAASLCWYYLEPGDPPIVKGPYDAGLMLRWHLGGFLTDALRIAGVVQTSSSSSSSRAPPASLENFQSLGQLLQQVQDGAGYCPAKAGPQEVPSSPAKRGNSAGRLHMQPHALQAHMAGVSLGSGGSGLGAAGGAGSGPGGAGILAKGGSLLTDTVGYYIDMVASAQLPGPMSLVQFLDKVVRQAEEAWD